MARAAWVVITLAGIGFFIAGVPLRYRQTALACDGELCIYGMQKPEALLALENAGLSATAYAAYLGGLSVMVALVYCAVGIFIFWRQSSDRIAWASSLWLVTFGLTLFEGEFRALASQYPWLQPVAAFYILLGGVVLLALFLFVFPNGRFVPRWTRWLYLFLLAVLSTISVSTLVAPSNPIAQMRLGEFLWGSMIVIGAACQLYRYRRVSGPIERQQTKWVMMGLLVVVAGVIVLFMANGIPLPFEDPELASVAVTLLEMSVAAFGFLAIPAAIGVSILRYRLWDADVFINRTLVYALMTAVLALLYFSSVLVLQQLAQALIGQPSPLAIVLSTLFIAALFSPLRRRLQDVIDRRFYRRKYDASQILAHFAKITQDEVDLNQLTTELLSAVQGTMEPERVSLWLREQDRPPV